MQDLSNPQVELYQWIEYYDWILSGSGPPPPDQEILDNDYELDAYVEGWKQDLKRKANPKGKNSDDPRSGSITFGN